MTLQQLKYVIAVAETGSITEAARKLFISQPSLSNQIREIEKELGRSLFKRSRSGVTLTVEGREFTGYARQVLHDMANLESRFIEKIPEKTVFGVSTQHYTFAENAFVEMVRRFGEDRYEFFFNETGTHQILEDVKNRTSNLGIIYLSRENQSVIQKDMADYDLEFHPLFSAGLHVFIQKDHPLAGLKIIDLDSLKPYPRVNFVQGNYESPFYSEEMFSIVPSDREIRVNDRGAIVRFMMGLNAYTISSGIFPRYLHGHEIISVPLDTDEEMQIGYVTPQNHILSKLEEAYIEEVMKYRP